MDNVSIRNIARVRYVCQQKRMHKFCKWATMYSSKSLAMINQCRHYSGGFCLSDDAQNEAFITEQNKRQGANDNMKGGEQL